MAPEIPGSQPMSHLPAADQHPTSDKAFLSTLETSSHSFLQPSQGLHAASLVLAKRYLDPLAAATSDAQTERRDILNRKRKREERGDHIYQKPLQLREVYLEGFKIEQVWEQARRVLDASRLEAERFLDRTVQERTPTGPSRRSCTSEPRAVTFKDVSEDASDSDRSDEQRSDADEDRFMAELDEESEELHESSTKNQDSESVDIANEDLLDTEDIVDDYAEDNRSDEESGLEEESKETFVPDKLGLNDGFFSIDDFNRQSEFLEHRDARGDNDGAASDEEEVDWTVNPLDIHPSGPGEIQQNRSLDELDDDEDDDEGGPTFGNANLNLPDVSESEDGSENEIQLEDIAGMNNTNDIKYADFFAPPPRKATKSNRQRALPKTQPSSSSDPQKDTEGDIQRTISAVRRDIFEDDLTPDEDGPGSDRDPRSSHQKRQAALTAEIRRLEAAAVAKRDWTLSGEARAADRPINSLLEEDLEFERVGKPIPVITHEVSEDIEALIKRRIIAREFDEVIKRRPGNLVTGNGDVRRGRFELEDTKPQQSLAEVYEAEHLKTVDPEGYVGKRDEKLKKEHAKIEQMWKDVSAKLDVLSSWHYKPKLPSASINVVADVPTISMEDARPSAGGDVNTESMLAPQEVYKAGEARDKKEEVVTGSGLPVGRRELTRDEKTRRRRREKERIRKAGGLMPAKGKKEMGKRTKEKEGVVGDLKKGGVKVIGKKGEIVDVEGRAVRSKASAGKSGGGYKL